MPPDRTARVSTAPATRRMWGGVNQLWGPGASAVQATGITRLQLANCGTGFSFAFSTQDRRCHLMDDHDR